MPEQHTVYLGLGANLGDRRSNLVQALQYIRARATLEKVSACYETKPVGYLEQPNFLNITCQITTTLSPHELLRFLKQIERRMGREVSFRNAPRPIDIDILFYDDLVLESPDVTIPHPSLSERAFVLAPLADIAPDLVHPLLNLTVSELLQRVDRAGVTRLPRGLSINLSKDVQETEPAIHVSLSRVGVTNLRRIIHLTQDGQENLFDAEIDLFADLDPRQMGVHMSRFSEVLESIIGELTFEKSPSIETLAERIANEVVARQRSLRSEVHIRAVYPMEKIAPLSGKPMQELYTLIGIAVSNQGHTKHIVGAEADGMTVCPCAQDMVREHSRDRLLEEGFSPEETERVLNTIPIASHNQRGRGTLLIGSEQEIRAENLVEIIEGSMSSETYDLLKRPDEFFVVNKAHHNPRFVEDVVREMLQNVVDMYPDLPDTDFVLAKQVNLESIHKHNAFAERSSTLGEIRGEIQRGHHPVKHTSMEEWLES